MNLDDISQAYENGYRQGKFEAWQWIPCSEKLPENGQLVLITNGRKKVILGIFQGIYMKDCHRWNWTGNTLIRALAWMPSPEAWEGK